MPHIDDQGNLLVRIVIDGAPGAGKSWTVRALASEVHPIAPGADAPVAGPESLELSGAVFDRRPVRCVVSASPSGAALAELRAQMLAQADAVVFVCDATVALDPAVRHLERLGPMLAPRDAPPIGLIVQANKRDLGGLPRKIIEQRLGQGTVLVIDASARTGQGLRDVFATSLNLAFERVRALMAAGNIPLLPVDQRQPSEPALEPTERVSEVGLHDRITVIGPPVDMEAASEDSLAAQLLRQTARMASVRPSRPPSLPFIDEAPTARYGALQVEGRDAALPPALPLDNIVKGLVWPPALGQALQVGLCGELGTPERAADGTWRVVNQDFALHSLREDWFASVDEARRGLWAAIGVLASLKSVLSEGRGLAVAETRLGGQRLWRISRRSPSLASSISLAARSGDVTRVAASVLEAAEALLDAGARFRDAAVELPISLSSLGRTASGQTVFIGERLDEPGDESHGLLPEALLRARLRPELDGIFSALGVDARQVALALEQQQGSGLLVGLLASLLSEP